MRTIQEQLRTKGLTEQQEPEKPPKRPQEKLSEREWAELMGMNGSTYARGKGGAIRRKR